MGRSKVNKLLATILVFMMMFSNFGYTISAIATSEEFEVITNGFFEKEELEFEAYFEEEGKEKNEKISNVNETVKLKVKMTPKIDGYLKNATIKAVSETGEEPNFRIKDIEIYNTDMELNQDENENKLVNLGKKTENVVEETNTVEEDVAKKDVTSENAVKDTNKVEEKEEPKAKDTNAIAEENVIANEVSKETNTVNENTVSNSVTNEVANTTENVVTNEIAENTINNTNTVEENVVSDESVEDIEEPEIEEPIPEEKEEEEVLIDEEKVIEEKSAEAEEEIIDLTSDVQIVSENEVSIVNVIEETEYVIEIEYVQGEMLKVEDLYREIRLQLTGTYINSDLEEVEIAKEEKVNVGWEYEKEIEINSEYTKVSPFKIGEKVGTIVENKITVKREIEEEKYLPVKETRIEINVPTFNGKAPIEVNVIANKLLATTGEDIGQVRFNSENWRYDNENGKIEVVVTNEKEGVAKNTQGIDEYTVIYRFEDYTEDITSKLNRNVKVEVEGYSARENKVVEKEIKEEQEIDVNVGELVTYSIDASEEKIEKSRIYANYNSEEALYETEYTSHITVNILTSDMLEKLKIDCSKEVYKDVNGYEFSADEVLYKNIKFNYSDIKNILQKGGNIEIKNKEGELLYTLDSTLIKSETDCIINTNYAKGIEVYVNNIGVNGTINFDVTKVIKKSNYEKAAFKNFTEIESRIKAEVKYTNIEQTLELEEIKTSKGLKESYTRANIYINRENLSTIQENENVEIKVELNNDKEDSDLYINPSFEFVFPKYVKEVHVESINLLYENGLRVSDFETYTETDIVKMRVELTGVQKTFSESVITNGTNILINVKIKVDEYTPSKEDQIKLYYCNEGVSNYESQTKWTISKQAPNGILKTTNGFDVALFNYQAPNGMVAINGIRNYDGNLSEIKSVRQGEKAEEIPMNSVSRIATMDLLTLNNTGNECTEVVLIGRIPFKGNTDVVTGEDLGTTTTGIMKDYIKEDVENFNMSTIYYSSNEKANKSLEDGANGWRLAEYVENISEVKSFMIVVKGSVAPGTVLKYNYDFEIPEKLQYEVKMAGSFGAYYNNNSEIAVVYESTVADEVGVTTEAGPKVEAELSVDIGNGTEVGEKRFLNYTLKVKNTGSITAENITVTNPVPRYAQLCKETNSLGHMIYAPVEDTEQKWTIEKLEPGEEKVYQYVLKTTQIPTVHAYYATEGDIYEDENGYYLLKGENKETAEKEYVTVPDIYIENKATVEVASLAITRESNTIKNKLVDSNFEIKLESVIKNKLELGEEIEYRFSILNLAEKDLEDVVLQFKMPTEVEYKGIEKNFNKHETEDGIDIIFDEETNILKAECERIYDYETITFNVRVKIIAANEKTNAYLECITSDGKIEKGEDVELSFLGGKLEVKQVTNLEGNTVLEQEEVEFGISIKNIGTAEVTSVRVQDIISENLDNVTVEYTGSASGEIYPEDRKIDTILYSIPVDSEILIKVHGNATTLDGEAKKIISNEALVSADYINELKTDVISLTILNNPNKVIKEPEEEKEKFDEDNQKVEEGKNSEDNENIVDNDENDNKKENETNSNGSDKNQVNNTQNNNSNGNTNSSSTGTGNNKTNNNSNLSSNASNNSSNNNSTSSTQKGNKNVNKYVISGETWLDVNKNGSKDDGESNISSVKVQLLKDGVMMKATTTDGNGQYNFSELSNGTYSVMFIYDEKLYVATNYKKQDVLESNNSDAYETNEGKAVTNTLTLKDSNLVDIDLGLQNKDDFNLNINKFITSSTVTINGKSEVYDYNDLELAKIEIPAKKLKDAVVDLEYKLVIENTGNVEGKATTVIDYIPVGMIFDANKNEGWYLGEDGNAYNDSLREVIIKPGEKKELKISLTKQMSEENTGTVSNKAIIEGFENDSGLTENSDNNTTTQETLVLIKTGGATDVVLTIIITITTFVIMKYVYKKVIIIKRDKFFNNKNEVKKEKSKKFYR